jgi:UDP-2-acetamido-3-amino-2,3-dideoxy-glucuronate N-acetyltransferase
MADVFIHPTALVETTDIGEGTRIWAFTHIAPQVHIGSRCNIGEHCYIETGASIGEEVTIKNGNQIWRGVTLETGVFVGPGVVFTNDLYPRSPRLPAAQARYQSDTWLVPTLVEQGASLGGGAILLAGKTVGKYAMVAAGTVVTKPVPAYALVVGNPMRIFGWVCCCGTRLTFGHDVTHCLVCNRAYRKYKEQVQAI